MNYQLLMLTVAQFSIDSDAIHAAERPSRLQSSPSESQYTC
jgi:hypothetical protein